jgi:hypothetical protein
MTITPDQIPGILERHAKWLRKEEGGELANLQGANLQYASLQDANLRGANLQDANLRGANLQYASLQDANLRGAKLRHANLQDANLQGANLQYANLRGAKLRHASLQDANLQDANLQYAKLQGANLRGAIYAFASVSFLGHGECGRTLIAMRHKEGDAPVLGCGCFYGNQTELRKFIADGPEKYRKTRTLALETVLALLDVRNPE